MNVLMTPVEIAVAEHAAVIRALGKRVIRDIIEIGRRLSDAKQALGHGNFLPWLEREFRWDERTARNFMQVNELALKSAKFSDLELPVSGLYLLARPSTPEEAREEVVTRAEAGEHLSVADVQRIVDDALFKQAEEKAAELRSQIEQREKEIRAEYAGKMLVSPATLQEEMQKAVANAVGELKRDLDKAEKKLAAANKQLELKPATEPKPVPKIDSNISLASTGIQIALETLARALTITAQQMVDIETATAQATNQQPIDRLAEARAHAATVRRWLDEFTSIAL